MGSFLTRAAATTAVAALALSATVVAELPAAAATTGCATAFGSYPSLKQGSTGAHAKALECLLSKAGYAVTVNASISAADARQIGAFRASVGLRRLPVAGHRAWSALLSRGSTPTLHSGARGADVKRLQVSIRSAGYSVSIGGVYDTATVRAVKTVQKAEHLAQTGTATAALWKHLQSGQVSAPAKKAVTKTVVKKATTSTTKGARALAFAKRQLGEPYRYGSAGPSSWDCSGLTMKAWKAAGVSLPHQTRSQFSRGKKISKSNLRKGDLVFFYSGISHVAIYAGNGNVIHASRPGKPVAYIKMKYMPFKGARRY
ncbi:MAG: hypothetical protein JWP61_2428 [Friedmanniella sp.]|nr:hypothetical protein [Friedmanniella sp.]